MRTGTTHPARRCRSARSSVSVPFVAVSAFSSPPKQPSGLSQRPISVQVWCCFTHSAFPGRVCSQTILSNRMTEGRRHLTPFLSRSSTRRSSARLSPSTWGLKDGMEHNTSQSTNLPLPALAEHLVPFYTFHQWHFFPVAPQALRFFGEPLFGRLNFGSSLGVSLWGLFFGGTPLRRSPFWRVPNFGGFFFEVSSLGFLLWELLFGGLNFGGFSSGSLF